MNAMVKKGTKTVVDQPQHRKLTIEQHSSR